VSFNENTTSGAVAVLGFDFATASKTTESATLIEVQATVTEAAVVLSALIRVAVPVVADIDREPIDTIALAGTELRTPRPTAAIATSATRLKFVVVDICFLSLVVTRNFLVAASR
jgi:hypothetical protein